MPPRYFKLFEIITVIHTNAKDLCLLCQVRILLISLVLNFTKIFEVSFSNYLKILQNPKIRIQQYIYNQLRTISVFILEFWQFGQIRKQILIKPEKLLEKNTEHRFKHYRAFGELISYNAFLAFITREIKEGRT